MSLSKDATRTSILGKEEQLRYHLSQMAYYLDCAQKDSEEMHRDLSKYNEHKKEAEMINALMESIC